MHSRYDRLRMDYLRLAVLLRDYYVLIIGSLRQKVYFPSQGKQTP